MKTLFILFHFLILQVNLLSSELNDTTQSKNTSSTNKQIIDENKIWHHGTYEKLEHEELIGEHHKKMKEDNNKKSSLTNI